MAPRGTISFDPSIRMRVVLVDAATRLDSTVQEVVPRQVVCLSHVAQQRTGVCVNGTDTVQLQYRGTKYWLLGADEAEVHAGRSWGSCDARGLWLPTAASTNPRDYAAAGSRLSGWPCNHDTMLELELRFHMFCDRPSISVLPAVDAFFEESALLPLYRFLSVLLIAAGWRGQRPARSPVTGVIPWYVTICP